MVDLAGERALRALQRLLADASAGGQAKVDALVALSQRTVLVPTWSSSEDGFRSLLNEQGESALPIFTDREALQAAGASLGWLEPHHEESAYREVGSREALRHVVAHDLQYLIVDLGAPHALEANRAEIEPLLTPAARRESAGPFAGVGRISTTMLEAVRNSSEAPEGGQHPVAPRFSTPPLAPPVPREFNDSAATASSIPATPRPSKIPTAIGEASGGLRLIAPEGPLPDALLEGLASVLREYPEVDWAGICDLARGETPPERTVVLRVEGYRERLEEIAGALRSQGRKLGHELDVLLLDATDGVRAARAAAVLFYPWRHSQNRA